MTAILEARRAVVLEAREWIGTPFVDMHHHKGVGCDCIGLVRGVGEGRGVLEISAADERRWYPYPPKPSLRRIVKALDNFGARLFAGVAALGDIGLFHIRGIDEPSHVGIITEIIDGKPRAYVHAHGTIGHVVEATAEPGMRQVGTWSYPGILG